MRGRNPDGDYVPDLLRPTRPAFFLRILTNGFEQMIAAPHRFVYLTRPKDLSTRCVSRSRTSDDSIAFVHCIRFLPLPASSRPQRRPAAGTACALVPTAGRNSNRSQRAGFAGAARRCGLPPVSKRNASFSRRPRSCFNAQHFPRVPRPTRLPVGCHRAAGLTCTMARGVVGGHAETRQGRGCALDETDARTRHWRQCIDGCCLTGVGYRERRNAESDFASKCSSASRLLARIFRLGQACRSASASCAQASIKCSQLSRMIKAALARKIILRGVVSSGRPCSSRKPRTDTTVLRDKPLESVQRGEFDETHTPCVKSSITSAADLQRETRLGPAPPEPVNVTSRAVVKKPLDLGDVLFSRPMKTGEFARGRLLGMELSDCKRWKILSQHPAQPACQRCSGLKQSP